VKNSVPAITPLFLGRPLGKEDPV